MSSCKELLLAIRSAEAGGALKPLYAADGSEAALCAARERAAHVAESCLENFGDAARAALFSGPGRTEIGGNHTDHQHGHVLCGSVDLDILACAAPNGTNTVRVISEGYPLVEVALDSLSPREEEKNTSAALVRGVSKMFRKAFNYMDSPVARGAKRRFDPIAGIQRL